MAAGGAGREGVGTWGLGGVGKALQWDTGTKVSLRGKETCNPPRLDL